jgi:voltage-gated potassium channel Kch
MIFLKTIVEFLKDKEYRDLLITSLVILAIGTVSYHYLEGWTWLDALYFSIITLTTIGYGDFSPVTQAGKLFTVIYILIGIGVILSFIQTVYHHYNRTRQDRRKRKNQMD